MEITNIQIRPNRNVGPGNKFLAYVTVTFDGGFVIEEIRLLENDSGAFLAMPSRKLAGPCPSCRVKNDLQAAFCNECGSGLTPAVANSNEGRIKLHCDVAHPITQEFRDKMLAAVLAAYRLGNGKAEEALVS